MASETAITEPAGMEPTTCSLRAMTEATGLDDARCLTCIWGSSKIADRRSAS